MTSKAINMSYTIKCCFLSVVIPLSPVSTGDKNIVFLNHSAVIREQICTLHQSRDFFVINIIRRKRESGISISFNDS